MRSALIPAARASSVARERRRARATSLPSPLPLPHDHADRGVPVPPLQDGPAVDGEEVARLQNALRMGDAVQDLVVDRGTQRRREPVVPLEGRDRPGVPNRPLSQRVQLPRAHPGAGRLPGQGQGAGHHPPRFPHGPDLQRGLARDPLLLPHPRHPLLLRGGARRRPRLGLHLGQPLELPACGGRTPSACCARSRRCRCASPSARQDHRPARAPGPAGRDRRRAPVAGDRPSASGAPRSRPPPPVPPGPPPPPRWAPGGAPRSRARSRTPGGRRRRSSRWRRTSGPERRRCATCLLQCTDPRCSRSWQTPPGARRLHGVADDLLLLAPPPAGRLLHGVAGRFILLFRGDPPRCALRPPVPPEARSPRLRPARGRREQRGPRPAKGVPPRRQREGHAPRGVPTRGASERK